MDSELYKEAFNAEIKPKFGHKRKLVSWYIPLYPDSSERDMLRLSNAYMRMVNKELKKYLPELVNAYDREIRKDTRMDGIFELRKTLDSALSKVREAVASRLVDDGIQERISKVASGIKKTAVAEWRRTVSKTLGVEIDEAYYKDELYRDALRSWSEDRALYFADTSDRMFEKIRDIIVRGYSSGDSTARIKQEIQNVYAQAKRISARDSGASVSLLNYEITKKNQTDAGVKEYMWSTRKDSKVRPCHASLDGKFFRWDSPPEMWYETVHFGKKWTGRYCHPGQDYNCRCRAVPRFEFGEVHIPIRSLYEDKE